MNNSMVLVLAFLGAVAGYVERFRPTIDLGSYPLEHMHPVIGSYFAGNVSRDTLTCFGNNDVEECSYMHTFICMLPGMRTVTQNFVRCDSLWGSRSVVVEVQGSVEFLRVNKLPEENVRGVMGVQQQSSSSPSSFSMFTVASDAVSSTVLTATRWLEIQSVGRSSVWKKEIKHIPSEPFYLCARSNHWQRGDSGMRLEFRPSYFRDNDYNWVIKKTLVHISLVVAISSMWLLPYIAAMVTSVVIFIHGFDYYLIALAFSGSVVCLTPFMFTKRNRHLAKLYLRYFFQRRQAREVRQLMRERRPLFQALYFSCASMCVGSLAGFCIYSYLGIDRELRNTIYKITLAASSAWLAFFLCRTHERFFRQWSWVPMTYAMTLLLELHLNPMSKEEAIVAIIVITFAVEWLLVPKVDLNSRIGRDLRGVHWLERGVMSGMWTSSVSAEGSPREEGGALPRGAAGGPRRYFEREKHPKKSTGRLPRGSEGGGEDEEDVDDTSGDLYSTSDREQRYSYRTQTDSDSAFDDDEDGDLDSGGGGTTTDDGAHIDAFNVETPPRTVSVHTVLSSPPSRPHEQGGHGPPPQTFPGKKSRRARSPRNDSSVLDRDAMSPPGTGSSVSGTPTGGTNTFNITINVTMSPGPGTGSAAGEEGVSPAHTEELVQKVQGAVTRAVMQSTH